jgi:hypothetical protein
MEYKFDGTKTLIYAGLNYKMLVFSEGTWRVDYWNDSIEQGDGRISGEWLPFCSGKEDTQTRARTRVIKVYEALTESLI